MVYDILKDDYKSLIFGLGITNSQQAIVDILEEHSTHMQFLQILLELGLVGLSLMILIYYL